MVPLPPGITPGWQRRRECRFRSCPTLCPSQPDPTAPTGSQPGSRRIPPEDVLLLPAPSSAQAGSNGPGTLPAQASGLALFEIMHPSLRVQLINNRKVLIIPLVPVFHKSSCCLMRSYEQALSSLTLLQDTETSQPKPSTLRQLKFPFLIGSWKAALSWFIPLLYSKF